MSEHDTGTGEGTAEAITPRRQGGGEPPRPAEVTDLSMFQLNLLRATAHLNGQGDKKDHGLNIMAAVEERTGEKVNHGRHYPNLDELVERGLIDKGKLDRRTNEYLISETGVRALQALNRGLAEDLAAIDEHGPAARWPRGDRVGRHTGGDGEGGE